MTPSAPGIIRGLLPVASRSFSHWYSSPASLVAERAARSRETMLQPMTSSTPSAGSRHTLSSGAPCQSPFVCSGRLYGGCGSAPIIVIGPSESWSRMPLAAMSPVMPAPTMRYLVVCMVSLSFRRRSRARAARGGFRAPPRTRGSRRGARAGRGRERRRERRRARARRTGRAARSTRRSRAPARCCRAGAGWSGRERVRSLVRLRESRRGHVISQPPACVVEHLVERIPVRAEALCEHVDGHALEDGRDEDLTLPRGQRRADALADRLEQCGALGIVLGAGPRVGEALPMLRLERHLAVSPGAPAHLHRCLEQRELVRPGAEAALAAEVVEATQHRDGGVAGSVLGELVELDRGELGESAGPPEHLEPRRPQQEPMEACHCLLAADALRIEVAMPLLESRGCCQRAHVRISVRSGQGLTFYRRRSALRGNKRRRVLRHLAVFLRDPALRMRRPANGHAAVPDVDVGMVVRALREVAEPHHEIDRLAEGRELELPHERVVLLLPVGHRGSLPLAGRANPARPYKTPEECVNRVTETSHGGRGAATETLRPPSSAATGATLGARRSP